MKILQIINAYYPPFSSGGAAYVAHNISTALTKRNHKVTVFTSNALSKDRLFHVKQNPNYVNGVEVYYFNNTLYKPSLHVYFSKDFVKAINKRIAEYDIVHLHEYRSYMCFVASYSVKRHNIPYILQAHGQLPTTMGQKKLKRIYDSLLGHKLLKEPSKLIALTKIEAQQYLDMGVPREKIDIVPNGIDLSDYHVLPSKGSFKKKFGIDEDERIVLFLGRIHRIKGIDILVEAFASITEELEDVRLVIAGPDDGYLHYVKNLTEMFGIKNKVLFTGILIGYEKCKAYVDAYVYVLPSRYEMFPMAPIEAVACGTPVILTENCGIAEHFGGKVGLVVKPNTTHLRKALLGMLLSNDIHSKFRENCKTMIQRFDIQNTISKLEDVYEKATGSSRSNALPIIGSAR